ncbi:MAG: hypothetical protein ACTSU5_03435 [Promethearchaeota archaeon]
MSDQIETIKQVWIKFVPEKGQFGVKAVSYFGEENVHYADQIDFSFIFPARPRPGIANMKIDRNGVTMEVRQPFVISGQYSDDGRTLKLSLHHEK